MRNRFLILVIVGCFAGGCDRRTARTKAPARAVATTQTVIAAAQPRYGWYQTLGNEADHVLTTKLSIPKVFDEKTGEIRIVRYVRVDAEGMTQLPPASGGWTTSADGRNEKGGFGYNGGIYVMEDEEHDDAIVLNVSYYWTTPDQVRGKLNKKVPAKIGVPLDVQLPGGCRLQVSWRAAPRP